MKRTSAPKKNFGQNPPLFLSQARRIARGGCALVLNHRLLFVLLGDPKEQEEP